MTTAEAYAQYRALMDEGSDAFLRPKDFVVRYAQVRRQWLKAKAQEPETEYIKRLLAAFRAPRYESASYKPQDGILLTELTRIAFIRSVTADFTSGGFDHVDRPCKPLTDDGYGLAMSDPTRRPDDWFPGYSERDGRLFVISSTTPTVVRVNYLRDLETPTLTETSSSTLAESDAAVTEILNRLAGRQDLTTDNPRYNSTTGREIPTTEANL